MGTGRGQKLKFPLQSVTLYLFSLDLTNYEVEESNNILWIHVVSSKLYIIYNRMIVLINTASFIPFQARQYILDYFTSILMEYVITTLLFIGHLFCIYTSDSKYIVCYSVLQIQIINSVKRWWNWILLLINLLSTTLLLQGIFL